MKSKKHLSIRAYILISVLTFIAISLLGVFLASYFLVKYKLANGVFESTSESLERICEKINTDNLADLRDDSYIRGVLADNASLQEGRSILVARDYEVIFDSEGMFEGTYIINKDVMTVMNGKSDELRHQFKKSVVIVRPVLVGDEIVGVIISRASLKKMHDQMFKEFQVIGLFIIIIFCIDIIFINIVSKNAVKDLEDINEQMLHTNQGNLQERMPEQRFAETESIAQSYNEILSKLSTIDQTRSEFVSNVSHELKTPITSMKVLAESITQNDNADVEDYKEFMTDIVDEIDRETKIINDLLTLVRTDSQNNQMNFEEKSIDEMMATIIKTVRPLAKQRNIDLSYECFKDVVADIDQVKLSLSISNLIENAVKYNVENGWVKVSLNEDHKYFYIKVADSGVGIPDDAKDKVFERFYRVDKARSRDTGGTGLGLSITRSIINAHRGTIKLYSESGKGTTFTVKIPIRQDRSKVKVILADEKKTDETNE